jgi:hypothetical protein
MSMLKDYEALKLAAAVSEIFHYTHPSKEVLNKTAIYHLIKIFWTLSDGKLLEKNDRDC